MQIESYEALSACISRHLRRGVATNAFGAKEAYIKEIKEKALSVEEWDDGLLLFYQRSGYQRMQFYLQSLSLPEFGCFSQPTVTEIASREKDSALHQATAFWQSQGFSLLYERQRLTLAKQTPVASVESPLCVRLVGPEEAPAVAALMRRCFDRITGCLPAQWELCDDIEKENLLCAVAPSGEIAGLLHIGREGAGTQLRHIAVAENFRRQGGAQNLLAAYLQHTQHARSVVWVRPDNEAGRQLYLNNGYQPDGWRSAVLYRP